MSVSRIVTSMTFSTLGLFFAAASIWSVWVSYSQITIGFFRGAAVTAAFGLLVVFSLLVILRPERRVSVVERLSNGRLPRTIAAALAVSAFAVAMTALAFLAFTRPEVAAGSRGLALIVVAAVVGLLTVTTFILPGFAYDPYRPELDQYYKVERRSLNDFLWFLDREDAIEPGRLHNILAVMGAMAFVLITGLGWYGLRYAQFLPSEEAQAWLAANGLTLRAVTFTSLGLSVALYPAATGRWFRGHRVVFKLVLILSMALPTYFAPAALSRGLPSLSALLLGREVGSAEVLLVAPVAYQRGRGCGRAALAIVVGQPSAEVTVCNIPATLWDGLRPTDILLLTGWQTSWGLEYLAYAAND